MKNRKTILSVLLVIFLALCAAGCVENETAENATVQTGNISAISAYKIAELPMTDPSSGENVSAKCSIWVSENETVWVEVVLTNLGTGKDITVEGVKGVLYNGTRVVELNDDRGRTVLSPNQTVCFYLYTGCSANELLSSPEKMTNLKIYVFGRNDAGNVEIIKKIESPFQRASRDLTYEIYSR